MDKKSTVKLIMFGVCPKCGQEFTRQSPANLAVCLCGNPEPEPTEVPLYPVLVLSKREHAKFSRLAELAGVPLEDLVSSLLTTAAKEYVQKLEALKSLPSMIVTMKGSKP